MQPLIPELDNSSVMISERDAVQIMVMAARGEGFRRPCNAERERIIGKIRSGLTGSEALTSVLGEPEKKSQPPTNDRGKHLLCAN